MTLGAILYFTVILIFLHRNRLFFNTIITKVIDHSMACYSPTARQRVMWAAWIGMFFTLAMVFPWMIGEAGWRACRVKLATQGSG